MAFASIEPFTNATLEAFYQFEWQPLDAPPPGSYFATNDLGTNNAGKSVNFSFGSAPDDPERAFDGDTANRSEEHTSELQSLMRISYAVFCLKKKTHNHIHISHYSYITHHHYTTFINLPHQT